MEKMYLYFEEHRNIRYAAGYIATSISGLQTNGRQTMAYGLDPACGAIVEVCL
jgi:hypothetical protein